MVHDEVTGWLFDDYLPAWVGVAAGTIARGPEFILDYWGVPLHYNTERGGQWLRDPSAVVRLLEKTQKRLRAERYARAEFSDHKVTVYHDVGAAIDVIWSRFRADASEIERLAAHSEVARGPADWRMVGIQTASRAAESLKAAWG
jgi:hypothetical protein